MSITEHRSPLTILATLCVLATGLVLLPGVARAAGEGCPNEALRLELNSGALPDCRAYEMVTPPYKEGYDFYLNSYASNGESAIVSSLADVAGDPGASQSLLEGAVYLDRRTAGGWQISPLNSPMSGFVGQVLLSAEANSGVSLWEQHTPKEPERMKGLYVRSGTGAFSFIGPLNLPLTAEEEKEESSRLEALQSRADAAIAATSNYDHVVLRAAVPEDYWSFDQTQGSHGSLYEYSGTGNKAPILVGVKGEEKGSDKLVGLCGTLLGAGSEGSMYNALSSGGETIFFTVLEKGYGGCSAAAPATTEVYARRYGSLVSPEPAKTTNVSVNECTEACGGEESGKNFEGASESGEKVFFTSTQKLTNDAVDGTASGNAAFSEGCAAMAEGSGGGCNLYEYDFDAPGTECQEEYRCLSLVAGGEVLGVVGLAEDGTWVYFASRSVLPGAGDNEYRNGPEEHQPNLYAYDTVTGSTEFIATLSGGDKSLWTREFRHPAEVSGGHGQFLLFASSTKGVTPDDKTELTQLFEYDAETGELVRVTQGEDGFNDNGIDVSRGTSSEAIANVASVLGEKYNFKSSTNRLNVAEDGKTMVFRSQAQLSPLALSAEKGCFNIYEFRWGSRLSEGGVRLLSDGRDVQPLNNGSCGAKFQAIDEDAQNILFQTADPLLASDVDGVQRDSYDAREGGGFPLVSSSSVCEGEACQGSASAVPVFSAPSSTAVTGGGGDLASAVAPKPVVKVKAKPCKRGFTKKDGKCAKREAKKKSKKHSRDRRARR